MTSASVTTGSGKRVSTPAGSELDRKKRRRRLLAAAGVLLLVLVAWLLWPSSSAVSRVRQMQQELFSSREQLSPEERKEKFAALKAEQEKLSDEERKEVRGEMRQVFQRKMNADAVKYLHMSPEERQKLIDQRLAREQERQQRGPQGGPGGGPGGPPRGPGAGAGGPGGPRNGGTSEQRDEMRRQFLLSATPEARAGRDQMRMDMATRRAELGLPPSTRGFGR